MSVSASPNYGILAAAATTTGLLLSPLIISGLVIGPISPYLPLASFRAKTDGVAQKAQGSTAAILSYTDLPNEQWHTGNPITGSLYEIYFDSVTNAPTGPASTWFGDTRDSWLGLGSQRTWTLQKDTASFGLSIHIILVEIRLIATPTTTTGPVSITFRCNYEI